MGWCSVKNTGTSLPLSFAILLTGDLHPLHEDDDASDKVILVEGCGFARR
jgi:hypothetical protein